MPGRRRECQEQERISGGRIGCQVNEQNVKRKEILSGGLNGGQEERNDIKWKENMT